MFAGRLVKPVKSRELTERSVLPLAPTVEREEIHTRHITMRAYRRADGLYDIEGRV